MDEVIIPHLYMYQIKALTQQFELLSASLELPTTDALHGHFNSEKLDFCTHLTFLALFYSLVLSLIFFHLFIFYKDCVFPRTCLKSCVVKYMENHVFPKWLILVKKKFDGKKESGTGLWDVEIVEACVREAERENMVIGEGLLARSFE